MEKEHKILVIDDDKDILTLIGIQLKKYGYSIFTENSAMRALDRLSYENYDLILLDQRMPEIEGIEFIETIKNSPILSHIPVIIMTAFGNIEDAVESMKKGAFHYITKPINFDELNLIIRQALNFSSLKKEVKNFKEILSTDIIAESPKMKSIVMYAEKIASSDVTVLITGESGVGKEVLAKLIHKKSKRKDKPFVAINCGAIPKDLLESELFGYKKGAFTGANSNKKGLIEEANGGTLFLDEIGELPLELQVKLLRVLQENEIRPIGSNKPQKIDVRFIAATNKNLEEMVKKGEFRKDLFYRLNIVPIHIPPLRERKEDIIPLSKYFLKKFSLKYNVEEKELTKEAINQLLNHSWDGNVRELEHIIERAVLLSDSKKIKNVLDINVSNSYIIKPFKELKEEFEKNYLKQLLEHTNYNISKASKISGKTRAELYRLIKKYNLKKSE